MDFCNINPINFWNDIPVKNEIQMTKMWRCIFVPRTKKTQKYGLNINKNETVKKMKIFLKFDKWKHYSFVYQVYILSLKS